MKTGASGSAFGDPPHQKQELDSLMTRNNNFFTSLLSRFPRRRRRQQHQEQQHHHDIYSRQWMTFMQDDLRRMIFHQQGQSMASSSTGVFVTTVSSLCLLMGLLIWKLSSVSRKKRRGRETKKPWLMNEEQQDYERQITALQAELEAKSVNENELAILWRQEKKILQARIEQLALGHLGAQQQPEQQQPTKLSRSAANRELASNLSMRGAEEAKEKEKKTEPIDGTTPPPPPSPCALQELQEHLAALTKLNQDQAEQLVIKQHQIDKLQNVMEEMQQALQQDGNTNATSSLSLDTDDDDDDEDEPEDGKAMDGTSHDQIVQRLLGKIAQQPNDVQEELEMQLCKRRLSQQSPPVQHIVEHDRDESDTVDIDTDTASSVGSTAEVLSEASSEPETPTTTVETATLDNHNKVVLLLSSMPGNLQVSMHQSRLEAIFRYGLKLAPDCLEVLDGCDADLVQLRNDLFRISGLHAVYPQVFLIEGGSDIQFLGDFDTVLELHDSRQLPERIGLVL